MPFKAILKIKLIHLFAFVALLLSSNCIGSNLPSDTNQKIVNYDTNYIESYYDNLVLTLVNVSKTNTVTIDNFVHAYDISLSTNKVTKWGIGIDYKWLAVQVTFPIRSISREEPDLGKTSGVDLSFGITKRKLWFRTFYEQNKGFHLSSNSEILNQGQDEIRIRPDINNEIFYLSGYYGFNYQKFSYMAALWQIEKQKKSASTFVAGVTFARDKISGDSSLIPMQVIEQLEGATPITSSSNKYIAINAGVAGTLVFLKNFFLTGTVVPGISFQYGKWKNEQRKTFNKNTSWNIPIDLKLGMGHIGKKSFFGFNFFYNSFDSAADNDNTGFNNEYLQFRVYAGYRFEVNSPKWMKKIYL